MLKHQPFGWLLDKDGIEDAYKLLNYVGENGATTAYHMLHFKELFELTLFADGEPFGIKNMAESLTVGLHLHPAYSTKQRTANITAATLPHSSLANTLNH